MKRLYILSILLLLLAISQYSCKPDPTVQPKEPVFTPLPQEVKDYCVFKYGSYWIYQDSISGALDTVTVQSYSIDTVNYPKIDGQLVGINEIFEIKVYHTFDGYTDVIKQFALTPPPPYPANNTFNISIWRLKEQLIHGDTYYLVYPFQLGKSYIPDNDTVKLVLKSDSIIQYHHGRHSGYGNSPVEIFHKRKIGIFRKEVKNKNQVWKLIDFHVNQ